MKSVFTFLFTVLVVVWNGVCFTHENNFPYTYHPDEPIKVQQVLTNRPNFEHPLLLINTTRVLAAVQGKLGGSDQQSIVELGRLSSSLFAILAILLFMAFAAQTHGAWGAVCVGTCLSFSSALLHAAHIMKEDTALLMGLAGVFLAFSLFWKRPTWLRWFGLAAACGLAVSAKYPAWLLVGMVLGILIFNRSWTTLPDWQWKGYRFRPGLLFFGIFGLTALILNYQVLFNLPQLVEGVLHDLGNVAFSKKDYIVHHPLQTYWSRFLTHTALPIQVFLGISLLFFLRTFQHRTTPEKLVLCFTLSYLLVLGVARIASARYYLPLEVFVYYFAAMGFLESVSLGCHWFEARLNPKSILSPQFLSKPLLQPLFILLGLGLLVSRLFLPYQTHVSSYEQDNRLALAVWVRTMLPSAAVIAQDQAVQLAYPTFSTVTTQKALPVIFTARRAADLGDLETLQRRGIRYVAVTQFQTYLKPDISPSSKKRAVFLKSKAFYQALQDHGKLRWARSTGVSLLQPPLRLYELTREVQD